MVVTELMNGGLLTPMLEDRRGIYSEEFCKYTLYRVVQSLIDLHSRNIVHRDIKSDNVYCSLDGDIKLSGFEFATILTQEEPTLDEKVGSVCWMAPEIIIG